MTIGAIVPFSLVPIGKNREILSIVIPWRIPAIGVVAKLAIGREAKLQVIGISGSVIVALMAGVTIAGSIFISAGMTC